MAKITLHIPTEQYGFVAIEVEDLPAEATVELYREYANAFKPRVGLSDKVFNHCIDQYMATGTLNGGTELYHQMNEKQQFFFQCLKKHSKRNGYQDNK